MRNIIQSESLAAKRPTERGSALVVALMSLVALFAITFAATKIRVASARDVEDKNIHATQYWQARSGAATIQASLITDIPAVFDAEMLRAQIAVAGYPLPAFDPPNIGLNLSRPVLNADGSITNSNASDCTSLLGNLNAWAARKTGIAENYARERGYGSDKARVAVFQESLRQQFVGASANSEPAYILEYQIDSAVGEQGNARGRVRPSGTIMLGPARPGCNTTVSLSANPTNIAVGSSSTLTITYTNASHVWVTDQTGATVAGTDTTGLTETNISQTLNFSVSPSDNTTYRAHAEGSGCRAVSAETTVIVNYPPPEVIQFSANPSCINRGQSATLTFQVRYATSITITGSGVNQTFPGNSGTTITSGSLVVSPTTDSTYTLTATGRGGTTTATTSITVKRSFTIDQFQSNTYCVIPGTAVNLSWANTNAETATITDSTTGSSIPVSPSSGTRSFVVNSSTTFTLTVTRTGCSGVETLTSQISLNTTPSPTATFAANPSDIELGNNSTLQWITTDASTVTITPSPVAGSGMSGPQTVTASGSLTIRPTAINQNPGYTYTLTATSDGCSPQTVTKTAVVTVRPAAVAPACPNVISFSADSCVVSGGSSTLRWNVADSDFVTISGPGVTQTFSSNPNGTGSLVVNPTADSTYTITATRSGSCTAASPPAPTTASINVRISQPATVNNFSASPSLIDAGQTSRLTWNESEKNISSVRITGIGGDNNTYNIPPGQQFLDVSPASTATYTITVTSNDCAAQTANQSLTVTVASCPTINSYTATTTNIVAGGSSTLQWSTSNAVQVLLNGRPVNTTGSLTVTPSTTTTYRLTAVSSNGACNVEQSITITVAGCPAPQINAFTVNPTEVFAGGNQIIRLAWSITDSSGTGVTVNISPGVGTFSVSNGFVDITQPQSSTTYTLTTTNGCGASATAQTTVTTTSCPAPTIANFSSSPNAVTIGGAQTIRLSWNVTDISGTGVSVAIANVGTFGPSGFVDIAQPQSTTTYTLTATAGCGAQISAQTTVVANPPTATTLQIKLPFFVTSGPGAIFANPLDPSVFTFPGDYALTASVGQTATVNVQFGAYSPGIVGNNCFGTQTFVGDDGVPWTFSIVAADGTVMDSFTFDRGSYDGSTLTWTGTKILTQPPAFVMFTTTFYMNRYQRNRVTGDCELVIDHAVVGNYTGTWDLTTNTFTNGGSFP